MTIYRADLSGVGGRMTNSLRQLAQLPWFVKNLGLKLVLSLGVAKVLRRFGRSVPEWPY